MAFAFPRDDRSRSRRRLALYALVAAAFAATGFLLARDLPDGTTAIELMLREAGAETLDGATPRVAARYPASAEERGVLVQQEERPPAQARRGRR